MKSKRTIIIIIAVISVMLLAGFLTLRNSSLQENGIGPVKELKLINAIDEKLVTSGKQIFDNKCGMCHMMNQCKVGPLMQGVTKRRKPEYILNMILNPVEMTSENSTAADLKSKYGMQMPNQNITQEEARAMLEYFRSYDK